jgi:fumagillin biosynthesis methyltransferase
MTKGYSKLLLDEHVLDDVDASHRGAASDMLMMLVLTGVERTRSQWKELLGSVGLKIVKVWPNRRGQQSVIEAEFIERVIVT